MAIANLGWIVCEVVAPDAYDQRSADPVTADVRLRSSLASAYGRCAAARANEAIGSNRALISSQVGAGGIWQALASPNLSITYTQVCLLAIALCTSQPASCRPFRKVEPHHHHKGARLSFRDRTGLTLTSNGTRSSFELERCHGMIVIRKGMLQRFLKSSCVLIRFPFHLARDREWRNPAKSAGLSKKKLHDRIGHPQ